MALPNVETKGKSIIPTPDGFSLLPGEVTLNSIIITSTLRQANTTLQLQNIVKAFNIHQSEEPVFTQSAIRGEQIPSGKFLLGSRNNRPQIVASGDGLNYAKVINFMPGTEIRALGLFNMNDQYITACGSHIINVAIGKFGVIRTGTSESCQLLGEGKIIQQKAAAAAHS